MKKLILLFLICTVSLATKARAEWVEVHSGNKIGIGYLFKYQDECRVLAPLHVFSPVEAPTDRANIRVPRNSGFIRVEIEDRYEDFDIAWARIQGTERPVTCTSTWVPVPANAYADVLRDALNKNVSLELRTRRDGIDKVVDASLREIDPHWLRFKIQDLSPDENRIRSMSGSGLYIGGTLVGIFTGYNPETGMMLALRMEIIPQYLRMAMRPVDPPETGITPDIEQQSTGIPTGPVDPTGKNIWPTNVTGCDLEAANASDPGRHPGSIGRTLEEVDAKTAIAACKSDLDNAPTSARLAYQYGRALQAGMEDKDLSITFQETFSALSEALELGHAHAIVNIRNLLVDDDGPCPYGDACVTLYLGFLDKLALLDRAEARETRADFYAYNEAALPVCGDRKACDEQALALYRILIDEDDFAAANADIAFLSETGRISLPCDETGTCLTFQVGAYRTAAADNTAWAQYRLGRLLKRNVDDPAICADPATCILEAVSALQSAIDNGASVWSYWELANIRAEERWAEVLPCSANGDCVRLAVEGYQALADAGEGYGYLEMAWANMYRTKELGCTDDPDPCFRKAAAYLAEENAPDDDWGKSLRASGIQIDPEIFGAFCKDNCMQTALTLHRDASKTRRWNLRKAGEMLVWNYHDLDCETEADCVFEGMDLLAEAFEKGDNRAFDAWTSGIEAMFSEIFVKPDPAMQPPPPANGAPVVVEYIDYCEINSDRCKDYAERWFAALPSVELGEQIWQRSRVALALLAINVLYPEMQQTSAVRFREVMDTLKDADLLSLGDLPYRLADCQSELCTETMTDLIDRARATENPDLVIFMFRSPLFDTCLKPGKTSCFGITREDIASLVDQADEGTVREIGGIFGASIWNRTLNPYEASLVETFLDKGVLYPRAIQARNALWDNGYQGDDLSRAEAIAVIRDLLEYAANGEHSVPRTNVGSDVAVALRGKPMQDRPVSLTVDAILMAAIHSPFKENITHRWLEQNVFGADTIRALQRRLGGIRVDGDYGEKTANAIESWVERTCAADPENCRASQSRRMAKALLAALDG
ncbi:peptidoglycan-binding domain-containing protein [Tropicibacter sp. S64]|uniref:peptidoglycan-binding domain-containing protein n=1 Tax=Tropicibacter sp. S64 TaxID=3415122 RepID=UPI003C7A6066